MRKIKSNHIKIAVTVVISGAILYAIMSIIDNMGLVYESVSSAVSFIVRLLMPVMTGFIIAFLLYRPAVFFGSAVGRIKFFGQRQRGAQVLGVFIAFLIFLGLIVSFLYLLVPSVVQSVGAITKEIPQYAQSIDNMLFDLSQNQSISQVFEFIGVDVSSTNSINAIISEFWMEITGIVQSFTSFLFSFIVNTGRFVYNFVLGLFFSVYMLVFKDQIKAQVIRISKNVLKDFYYKPAFLLRVANDMFYKFLVGKGICSLAVGAVTFAACAILGFKYTPLISLIVAVTNMVPTFGPFIGAIPATLLAMMTAPVYGLYMIIIIVGLQIIDGNILGPRVLGGSIGINGFWIIFSIIVMGGLFGVVGMLAAAPLFGLIRILLKNWIFKKENPGQKLQGEAEYAASVQRYRRWMVKKMK